MNTKNLFRLAPFLIGALAFAGGLALAVLPARVSAAEQVTVNGSGVTVGDTAGDRAGYHGFAVVQRSGAAQAALTDSTGGDVTAFSLPAGTGLTTISIPVDLPSLANGNVAPTAFTVGYGFKIVSATFVVTKPATTGSKASTLTMKIGSTAITGFSIALTSANCTPVGALVASSAISALNVGLLTDTITLVAGSTTAFVEGTGVLLLTVQNTDLAAAIARESKLLNEIRAALVAQGDIKGSS